MDRFKKTIKRMAALVGGAVMVGASLAGAMAAADLGNLPHPFVNDNGVFDAYVVVGSMGWQEGLTYTASSVQGLASDVATGIDVAAAFAQKATSAVQGQEEVLTGDVYKVQDSNGNDLDLYATSHGTASSDDMPNTLAQHTMSLDNGDFTYDQYLKVSDNAKVTFTTDPDDDSAVAQWYLMFPKNNDAYQYKLTFSKTLTADSTSNDGDYDELENEKINILGKEYTITKATMYDKDGDGNKDQNTLKLELMGGATEVTQNEYETKTYTVNGKEYTVNVLSIGTDSNNKLVVNMEINGETLNDLHVGETKKLSDGTEIGIKSMLENEAGELGQDQVTFYIGADKLTFEDDDISSTTTHGTLYVGSNEIEDVTVDIIGESTTSQVKISEIDVTYTPTDDIYVPAGHKLSEKLEDKNAILGQAFDYEFDGITSAPTEDIKLIHDGDTKYRLTFTAADGTSYSGTFVYDNSGTVRFGTEDGSFVNSESTALSVNDIFPVTVGDTTHIMEIYKLDNSANKITIKDLNTGDKFEKDYSEDTNFDGSADATIYFRGQAISFDINDSSSQVKVDMNGDGDFSDTVNILTSKGAELKVGSGWLNLTTENLQDSSSGETIGLHFADASNVLKLNSVYLQSPSTGLKAEKDGSDTYIGYTKYGVKVVNDESDAQHDVTITYPDDQLFANVYVTGENVKKTTTSGAVNINYLSGANGVARLDVDFDANTPDKPVILIGGPAVNKLVYNLAEEGKTQTADEYQKDTAIIQLIEDAYGSNDALIIAGQAAKDTRMAGKVVASYLLQGQFADDLSGKDKVVINTANAATVNDVTFE